MPVSELVQILDQQDGVISRRQALAGGVPLAELRRRTRRREWAAVHRGVYVNHTGPLTWRQRAWAACLAAWPAALCHESSLRAADGPGRRGSDDDVIHVAIESGRQSLGLEGVRVHQLASFRTRVQWNYGPPRIRVEDAVLDLAAEALDDLAAIGVLADAVSARRTTAPRLLGALDSRLRVARRELLRAALTDVHQGTHSALEHAFLTDVERAHGLPRGDRQSRDTLDDAGSGRARSIYRDVEYAGFGLVVELDGRLAHDSARARDADLARDLATLANGRDTVRIGWGQATRRACETARLLGEILARRGWTGSVTPCPRCRPT